MTLVYRQEYSKTLGSENVPSVMLPQEWLATAPEAQRDVVAEETYYFLPHCTEKTNEPGSVGLWQKAFARAGLKLEVLASGCCGMSGTYGHETRNAKTSDIIYSHEGRLLADGTHAAARSNARMARSCSTVASAAGTGEGAVTGLRAFRRSIGTIGVFNTSRATCAIECDARRQGAASHLSTDQAATLRFGVCAQRSSECLVCTFSVLRVDVLVQGVGKFSQLTFGQSHVHADAHMRLQLCLCAWNGRQHRHGGQLTDLPGDVIAFEDIAEKMRLQVFIDYGRELEQRALYRGTHQPGLICRSGIQQLGTFRNRLARLAAGLIVQTA